MVIQVSRGLFLKLLLFGVRNSYLSSIIEQYRSRACLSFSQVTLDKHEASSQVELETAVKVPVTNLNSNRNNRL